jgi:hypothetical protein
VTFRLRLACNAVAVLPDREAAVDRRAKMCSGAAL